MEFIEHYTDVLTPAQCEALIVRFEDSPRKTRGATGSGVNIKLKDSWDITLNEFPEWSDAVQMLNNAMMQALVMYVRKYPYAALAPFYTQKSNPDTGEITTMEPHQFAAMTDSEIAQVIAKLFRPGGINIQKYLSNQGGYPHWHSEIYPTTGNTESLHRALLWTAYLNENFEEGETEFFHQRMKVTPKTGSLLIAPAGFTHTHRGQRPKNGDKYIATSWVLLQKAETLYRVPTPAS